MTRIELSGFYGQLSPFADTLVSFSRGRFQTRFWASRPRIWRFAFEVWRRLPKRPGLKPGTAAAAPAASIDHQMMARCIEISREAAARGELPFASLICKDGTIVAESGNRVIEEGDVSRHAEILALSLAQRGAGSKRLRGHTLYASVEPCPMCAFAIRETGISRVVYAIRSPVMGGHSRWPILGDGELSRAMPVYFSPPPEIVADFCTVEAEQVWRDCLPLMWKVIKARGSLG